MFYQDQLDYEVDSDDEWEEEEPGESLSDCEKDKDDEEEVPEEDDDDRDGFFVPHGYLSEGEGCDDEEEEVRHRFCVPYYKQVGNQNFVVLLH